MANRPDCPIDLNGLSSHDRACVMICRHDCPIDLTGLDSKDRAWVMVERHDCPIDLTGLSSYNRAKVITSRPDCPIDLTGLNPKDIAWVMASRAQDRHVQLERGGTMNADPRRLLLLHGYGAKTGQAFSHFIDPDSEAWFGVDDSMLVILERGPRSQRYRMTWDDVLVDWPSPRRVRTHQAQSDRWGSLGAWPSP